MNFEREFTVEWGDCDEAGIVYYPHYFYWFDCTFQGWLRSHGLSQRVLRARWSAVTPLVDVGAEFRAPVRYDDVLHVRATLEACEARHFRVGYAVRHGARLVAVGHEQRAWAALGPDGQLRGDEMPQAFVALLGQG